MCESVWTGLSPGRRRLSGTRPSLAVEWTPHSLRPHSCSPLVHSPTRLPAGETWDYMGSRRLLLDMSMNTTSTSGLNLTLIDQVIELGQV